MAKNRKQTTLLLAEKLYSAARGIEQTIENVRSLEVPPIDGCRQTRMNLEAEAARSYWERMGMIIIFIKIYSYITAPNR